MKFIKNRKSKFRCAILKIAALAGAVLCFAALPFGGAVQGKADRTLQESNTSYVMAAVSDENSVGVAVTYVSAAGDTQMEFDLLKNVENGCFGVLAGEESSLARLSGDYVAFTASGSSFLSQGMNAAQFTFKSGYRYRVEWKSQQKTLSIFRKPYAAYDEISFEKVYESPVSKTVNALGVFARSQGENSAAVCIDNFYAKLADGSIVEENFNKRVGNIKTEYSNVSSYGQLSAGARYTVVFTDLNGNAVKVVDTSEYGYAMCEGPKVEGKTFLGWNINPKCVTSDMVLYPIYKDGEEENGGNTASSGCNGSVAGVGCTALAVTAFAVALKRKGGNV